MSDSDLKYVEGDEKLVSAVASDNQSLIAPLSLSVPPFGTIDTNLWFMVFEYQLVHHRIRQDRDKFTALLGCLPAEMLTKLREVLLSQIPLCASSNTRYEVLKAAVSQAVAPSLRARADAFTRGMELGDKTPSQLLYEMRALVGPTFDDDLLREMWLSRLPLMTQALITANPSLTSAAAATMADSLARCADEAKRPLVAAYSPAPAPATLPTPATVQAQHGEHRNTLRPILGQDHRESTASGDVSTDQSSMLHAISAEITALRSAFQRSQHPRIQPASRRPQPLNRWQPSPSTSQAPAEGICWYHRNFGDAARRCTPWCTYKRQTQGN